MEESFSSLLREGGSGRGFRKGVRGLGSRFADRSLPFAAVLWSISQPHLVHHQPKHVLIKNLIIIKIIQRTVIRNHIIPLLAGDRTRVVGI